MDSREQEHFGSRPNEDSFWKKIGPFVSRAGKLVFDKDSFWEKAGRFVRRAGKPVIVPALVLYYCLEDPDTPQWACRIIKGALVYFVMPIDAIPDFIPFAGFADDLAVLVLAIALVVIHIKPEHKKMAEEKWESLWSKANPNL